MAIKDVPSIVSEREQQERQNLDTILASDESELPAFTAIDTETGYFQMVDLRVVNKEAERYYGVVRFSDKNNKRYKIGFMLEFNRPFIAEYDEKGRYVGGKFLRSQGVNSPNPVKWVIPYCKRNLLNGYDFGNGIIDFVMVNYRGVLKGSKK